MILGHLAEVMILLFLRFSKRLELLQTIDEILLHRISHVSAMTTESQLWMIYLETLLTESRRLHRAQLLLFLILIMEVSFLFQT